MATRKGLEPSTSGVTGRRSNQLNYRAKCETVLCQLHKIKSERFHFGGNNRARTCDIMLVRHALYQLSYAPLLTAVVVATKVIILNLACLVNTKFAFSPLPPPGPLLGASVGGQGGDIAYILLSSSSSSEVS